MANEAIGMMDGGYFVGRASLLTWLNSFLNLKYERVEQCCTAVAHLQIMDALFPGEIPLHKVNFEANPKHSYECLQNFKILQDVFSKKQINRVIPVEKLVLGRYQDNLEFLQWMKSYFDRNWNETRTYDGFGRRAEAMGRKNAGKSQSFKKAPTSSTPPPSTTPLSSNPRGMTSTATALSQPLANISNTSQEVPPAPPLPLPSQPQSSPMAVDSHTLSLDITPTTSTAEELTITTNSTIGNSSSSSSSSNLLNGMSSTLSPPYQSMTTVDAIRARMRNVRSAPLDLSTEIKQSTDLVQQVNQAKMDAYVQRKQALFYYGKLREIEEVLTSSEFMSQFGTSEPALLLGKKIRSILYAETEDFVCPGKEPPVTTMPTMMVPQGDSDMINNENA